MAEEVTEAPVTPLGGQPVRRVSPTHTEVKDNAEANDAVCQVLWKELQEKLADVEKRLPQGIDKATNELAAYLHYNKSKVETVIK